MTAQPLFDTARFRDRLTGSGMPEGQARALTEGLDEAFRGATATKADVDRVGAQVVELDAKMDAVALRLDAKMDSTASRLDAKIDAVEAKLNNKIDALDKKIDAVEERLGGRIALLGETIATRLAEVRAETTESQNTQLRWIVASLFGGLGLLFAALKLFP